MAITVPYTVALWSAALLLFLGNVSVAVGTVWSAYRAMASDRWWAPLYTAAVGAVIVPFTLGGVWAAANVLRAA